MIRIAATFCFSLTLLCPIFCLAGAEAGGDCVDQGRSEARNCEAMSVGAVVARAEFAATPLSRLLPAFDRFSAGEPPVVGTSPPSRASTRGPAGLEPPPAAARRALLQIYLF